MGIRTVLFDADGVLQRRPAGWRNVLQGIVGPDRDPDRFLADLFLAETPALCGGRDFADGLTEVRRRWQCRADVSGLLDVWKMIEVDQDVVRVIRGLKRNGLQCHLATNQEAYRAGHMSEALGYKRLFDREFYSCDLGVAKPSEPYFTAILASIGAEPDSVLFIDDRPENVESARGVGMHAAQFVLDSGANMLQQVLDAFGVRGAPQRYAGQEADLTAAVREVVPPYEFALVHRDVGTDRGLTLHVFGPVQGAQEEILRFDCFRHAPHYHLGWSYRDEPFVEIPRVADPLRWAIDSLGRHFDEFVSRAGGDVVLTDDLRTGIAAALERLGTRAGQLAA